MPYGSQAPPSSVPLRLPGKDGIAAAYTVSVCSFAKDNQKYFILQALPEPVTTGREQAGYAGVALKQKLDCALQLARTVALDFNNALTSILGHTSLVLSKMEPTHPWRASLIEVEKSAAKAAEIANDLGTFSRQEKEARAQAAGNLNCSCSAAWNSSSRTPGRLRRSGPCSWTGSSSRPSLTRPRCSRPS